MIRRRHERGDTLVEVTIALAIISSVIAATASLSSAGFRLGQTARQRTEAASIMQQEAELLRNQRDADLTNGGGWAAFTASILGGVVAPTCGNSPANLTLPYAIPTIGNGNTSVKASTDLYGSPIPPLTVTTSQGFYATWLEVCAIGGSTDDLRFTVQIRWLAAANSATQQSSLDTELANVGDIQPLAQSPQGGVGPSGPIISQALIYGELSNFSTMYDNGQCRIACEQPVLNYAVTGAISCTLGGLPYPVTNPSYTFQISNSYNSSAGTFTIPFACSGPGGTTTVPITYTVVYCEPTIDAPWPRAGYGKFYPPGGGSPPTPQACSRQLP